MIREQPRGAGPAPSGRAARALWIAASAVVALSAILLRPAPAGALDVDESRFGLGLIAGEPTGGTLKLWLGGGMALQSHLAITWWGVDRFFGSVDFLWHPSVVTTNRYFELHWYFGVGGAAGFRAPFDDPDRPRGPGDDPGDDDWEADPAAWIRVPFGFSFLFEAVPVEAFVEFGPSMRLYPPIGFGPFLAVGGRWVF